MGLTISQHRSALDDCTAIALSCAAFTGSYFLLRRCAFPTMSAGFNNRMTSLLHALIMLPLSASVVNFQQPWLDFGTTTSPPQAFCLCVASGYMVYDTVGVYVIEHDWTNTVHHLASLVAFSIGIFQRKSGSELIWSLFLLEITNPLLHLRSFFKVAFALSFLACRLLVGPVLTYKVLACPTSSLVVKTGGAGIQILSFYWAYLIVRIAVFKARKRKADKEG